MVRKRISKKNKRRKYEHRKYERPTSTHLITVQTVIAALGGLAATARVTQCRNTTSIHNWVAFQQFPAKYYKVMTAALAARGYTAMHALWDQRGNHDLAKSFAFAA